MFLSSESLIIRVCSRLVCQRRGWPSLPRTSTYFPCRRRAFSIFPLKRAHARTHMHASLSHFPLENHFGNDELAHSHKYELTNKSLILYYRGLKGYVYLFLPWQMSLSGSPPLCDEGLIPLSSWAPLLPFAHMLLQPFVYSGEMAEGKQKEIQRNWSKEAQHDRCLRYMLCIFISSMDTYFLLHLLSLSAKGEWKGRGRGRETSISPLQWASKRLQGRKSACFLWRETCCTHIHSGASKLSIIRRVYSRIS